MEVDCISLDKQMHIRYIKLVVKLAFPSKCQKKSSAIHANSPLRIVTWSTFTC